MTTKKRKHISLKDVEAVKSKLEDFLKRGLSVNEAKAFEKLINSGSIVKLDRSKSSFFKPTKEADVHGLADALEDAVTKSAEKEAGWTFQWTYNF